MFQQKFPGIAANTREERTLDIELPMADIQKPLESEHSIRSDQKSYGDDNTTYSEKDNRLGHSFYGDIIKIEYFLAVFVKPDSWNAFGEGAFVKFPITIRDPPIKKLKPKKNILPEGWNPVLLDTT